MRFAVIDSGHYLDFATILAEKGHEVFYAVDWFRAFPRVEDYATGMGYERLYPTFRKVLSPGYALRSADYVVFTDVGLGDLATYLRERGVRVWGASLPAQYLETDRVFMDAFTRRVLKGARPREARIARGFDGLRSAVSEMLARHEYVVVKMSVFRGNMETQIVRSLEDLEVVFSQTNLEPIQEHLTFLVESPAAGVEWGFDGYFNGEDWVRPYAVSPEAKGLGACFVVLHDRTFMDDLFLDRLGEWLASVGFRGFMSLEFFLDGENVYITDYTVRLPYPGAGLLARLYGNVDEVVASALDGNPVAPRVVARYGVEMRVYPASTTRWLPFSVPVDRWTFCGRRWSVYRGDSEGRRNLLYVPGGTDLGSAIGISSDGIRQAFDMAVEVASGYEAPDVQYSTASWEAFEEKRRFVEEHYGRLY